MKIENEILEVELGTIVPRFIAQKCVVCGGHGTVGYERKTCHGCHGRGFLELPVQEGEQNE